MNLPTVAIPKITKSSELSHLAAVATPVVAIIVSIIVVVFITWPRFSEVLKLRESNRELSTRVGNLETKAAALESLGSDSQKLDMQLAAAEQLLPSDKGVFTLLRQVETSAASSGVLIGRAEIAPGSVGEESGASQAPAPPPPGSAGDVAPKLILKITLTSDFGSFLQFIRNALAFSRAVSIGDLSVSASAGGAGLTQVRTALTVNAYWQPLPQELGSIETPVEGLTTAEVELLSKVVLPSAVSEGVGEATIPAVPIGKGDFFAPF